MSPTQPISPPIGLFILPLVWRLLGVLRPLVILSALVPVVSCDAGNHHPAGEATASNRTFTQYQSGAPVVRGTPLRFPDDHGSHPQQSIEWWYLTSNLQSDDGSTFGVQWTLFRARLPENESTPTTENNPWWQNQFYFAHFALQSDTAHHAFERFGRAGQVQIHAAPFRASLDDWVLASTQSQRSQQSQQSETFLPLQLQAQSRKEAQDFAVDLKLDHSPIVAHGDAGYSQKTPEGNASYYYSLPFLSASGSLTFAGKTYSVSGDAWLDREWSGGLLNSDFTGWDWFSLQSDWQDSEQNNAQNNAQNNTQRIAIMAFCLRGSDHQYQYCDATRITQTTDRPHSVKTEVIPQSNIALVATDTAILDDTSYPVQWQLTLNQQTLVIEAVNPDSRNALTFPYWEGRVTFRELSPAKQIGLQGKGYAELTGY